MSTVIDNFYSNMNQLLRMADEANDASLHIWFAEHLRRILVIVEANYFENEIIEIMKNFFSTNTNHAMIKEFLIKSMDRKYYTYFQWKSDGHPNANSFFAHFGNEFKKKAQIDVKSTPALDDAIVSFLELGATRNVLIHNKLYEIDIPKTAAEYYELYKKALPFIDYLKQNLR